MLNLFNKSELGGTVVCHEDSKSTKKFEAANGSMILRIYAIDSLQVMLLGPKMIIPQEEKERRDGHHHFEDSHVRDELTE